MKIASPLRKTVLLVAASSLLFTGCGGSGSGGGGVKGLSVSGKLVDGYVKDAVVTLDVNDDRICQGTEPTVITDFYGNFTFPAFQNPNGGVHMTCASGGTDISTGLPFVGKLLSPPGATQITPLTTLIMSQIISDPTLAGADAATVSATAVILSRTLASNLGITQDPMAGASNPGGVPDLLNQDPLGTGNTPTLFEATVAAQVMMQQAAAAIGAATTAPPSLTNQLYQDAAQAVAANLFSATAAPPPAIVLAVANNPSVPCAPWVQQGNPMIVCVPTVTPATALTGIASSVVAATLTNVKNDPAIIAAQSSVSSNAATLAPTSVAAFVGPAISNTVTTLVNAISGSPYSWTTASIGTITPFLFNAQSNLTIANSTGMAASLLTNAVANGNTPAQQTTLLANLSTLSNTMQTQLALVQTNPANSASAASSIASAMTLAASGVVVPVASVPVVTATSVSNATALQNTWPINSLMVNGTAVAKNASGVLTASTLTGVGLKTATLNLGMPILTNPYLFASRINTLTAVNQSVDIGFRISSTIANDKRQLIVAMKYVGVIPDTVNVGALNVTGVLNIYVYGVNKLGNTANATLTSTALPATLVTTTTSAMGSNINVDLAALLTTLGQANPAFAGLLATKGTFAVDMIMGGSTGGIPPSPLAIPGPIPVMQAMYPLSISSSVMAPSMTIDVPNTSNPQAGFTGQLIGVSGYSQSMTVTVN